MMGIDNWGVSYCGVDIVVTKQLLGLTRILDWGTGSKIKQTLIS